MSSCTQLRRHSECSSSVLLVFFFFLSLLCVCFTSWLKHVVLFFSLLFYFLALANEKVEDINGCPRSQSQMVRIMFILNIMPVFTSRVNCIYKWTRNFFCICPCLFKKPFDCILSCMYIFFGCSLGKSNGISMFEYV